MMKTKILPSNALEVLLNACKPIDDVVYKPILESLGYVLAEDITSNLDIPLFDKSPLDGYAIRAEDTENASSNNPVTLEVIDYVPAGYVSDKTIKQGQAIRIMTGAKIPNGANVIVKFEDTDFTETEVKIYKKYDRNSNIIKKAEDIKKGDKILKKGSLIDAPEIGILATLGCGYVKVFRKPKVAVISTGDELVEIGRLLEDGKIMNSNSYFIAAQIKKLGAKPVILGVCKDKLKDIKKAVSSALEWADMVITTGGVSVGDRDLVKDVFRELEAQPLFWRVKMKPGSPMVAAKYKNKFLIGLSGNPAAAYITFELFVRPIILKQMGRCDFRLKKVKSTLKSKFSKVRNQDRFVRAKTVYENGKFYTYLPKQHSSGIVSSLSGTNSLLRIPAKEGPFEPGQEVIVQLLDY